MYHRHLKTPSLLQVHGTTSSVVFVFTPLTIRTLHLPATSHDSVRVVQKSWTHWTWHAAPVTWLDPYSLLFCVLWQTCSWPVYLILTWQFTPTLAWILCTLYTNNAICDPKSTESEHARKNYRKSTPFPETNHSDPSPTPRPSKCSTTHTPPPCRIIQIPAGGNSCCTQRRCHPRPPLTRPQPHHRHSLEWCAVLCSGENSETRKLLP